MRDGQHFEVLLFFFSSRRRHTRLQGDWSSDVCSAVVVASVSAAFHAGSFRWIAQSQPIARHERRASLTRSGPRDTATTSPWPRFSLMRRASSTAYSSYGDTIQVMPVVSIARGSVEIFTCVAVSGTCLMATRIFMRPLL